MPDRKLHYWYDWDIFGPDGNILVSLRTSPPPIDKDRLSDTNYLCERIIEFPDSTLMNSDVWYTIAMLRQRAFKDKPATDDLKRVCKAILGHGRKRKTQEGLNKLRIMVHKDICFFKEFLKQDRKDITIDAAIHEFLAGNPTDDETEKQGDEKVAGDKYIQLVFYSYNRIYKILKSKLTDTEIFDFFEKAASNIQKTNVTINARPDGRPLTYVKTKTWYTLGLDMHTEST